MSIGAIEIAIIAVFAFLIFGPDKLPGVIKNVTQVWNQLKGLRAQADEVIKAEVVEPLKDIESTINPLAADGKSATDALAARLGIKGDSKKKTEEKKKAEEAAKAAGDGTSDEAEATEADAAADKAESQAAAPVVAKPKTESFAEKKARLERKLREKQEAEAAAKAALVAASNFSATTAADSATTTDDTPAAAATTSEAATTPQEKTAEN